MLVHVVNAANCTFYTNYIEQIHKQRLDDALRISPQSAELPINKKHIATLNDMVKSEYLLNISSSGDLVDYCICTPTYDDEKLIDKFASFISEDINLGPEVWLYEHRGPIIELDEFQNEISLAYFCTGLNEWALTKGIGYLLGLVEQSCADLAKKLGFFHRALGMKQAYDGLKTAQAIELMPTKKSLETARFMFNIYSPVTFVAPPQFDFREISKEQIAFIDAAHHAVQANKDSANFDS